MFGFGKRKRYFVELIRNNGIGLDLEVKSVPYDELPPPTAVSDTYATYDEAFNQIRVVMERIANQIKFI